MYISDDIRKMYIFGDVQKMYIFLDVHPDYMYNISCVKAIYIYIYILLSYTATFSHVIRMYIRKDASFLYIQKNVH